MGYSLAVHDGAEDSLPGDGEESVHDYTDEGL
jgi:hypothetical protein